MTSRADQDTNWRVHKPLTNIPTCRYCKQNGHNISECPTRPPRRNERPPRRNERPPRRNERPPRHNDQHSEEAPSEMFWPNLCREKKEDPTAVTLQGAWGENNLLDKIKAFEDEKDTQEEVLVEGSPKWTILGHPKAFAT